MSYKTELADAMFDLSQDARTRFIGYGLQRGRAAGSLVDIPDELILETPVAENLMMGVAIGQSLAGRLPVVYFERFDFVLNAADAIVNHLSAAQYISRGAFTPAVIIRVVVGNREKPLFTGLTHTQNFAEAFASMCRFPVVELQADGDIIPQYAAARERQLFGESTMLVEYKDQI